MAGPTDAPTLRVLSSLAVRTAIEAAILPGFAAAAGARVELGWHPTTVILRELAAGAPCDVIVVVASAMDDLARQGVVDPASRVDLAQSRVGLAVRAGAPHPAVGTLEAFRQALLSARSVAWSRTGASGLHFETVLDRLGIGAEIRARGTVIGAGFTAEKLVSGEADLAVQQVSELMAVPGIEIVGRFPDEVQEVATLSAAVLPGAADRALADRFLAALATPEAAAAYRAGGLDPIV
jgi:molybdate transport system substrate-binding protein